jgi:hypothetical protein
MDRRTAARCTHHRDEDELAEPAKTTSNSLRLGESTPSAGAEETAFTQAAKLRRGDQFPGEDRHHSL